MAAHDIIMAAAGGSTAATYIEDVFSTWLFNGSTFASTVNVNNGFDMTTKKGLIISKTRSTTGGFSFVDTTRGQDYTLFSNTTGAQAYQTLSTVNAFQSTGFSWITGSGGDNPTVAGWTLLQQPKFFDVVTGTADSSGNVSFSHSLGAAPGFVIIKSTTNASQWFCYHQSLGTSYSILLNTTGAAVNQGAGFVTSTSTTFSMNTGFGAGAVGYVAYLFAHNAGGFGLTGTDNVISCGSFTTDGSGYIPTVNLGYEPQWVLAKPSSGTGNWFIMDNMRGWYNQQADQGNALFPNTSGAEAAGYNAMIPTATGFTGPAVNFGAGITYIYIAIRRGPMKVPTDATKVYQGTTYTGNATTRTISTSPETPDFAIVKARGSATYTAPYTSTRLCGSQMYMSTDSTAAEANGGGGWINMDLMNGFQMSGSSGGGNASGVSYVTWPFARAPSVFDVVCWASTGAAQTINHNLGVVPELMIRKVRNGTWEGWMVYAAPIGNNKILYLDQTAAQDPNTGWNNQTPTSTQFFVNNTLSGYNFVTYLFASCPGVSKVGSYTGTGATQTINCGFTGGARFVLIKRTDSTGDWYVWDTARGMVSGTDPSLLLNSTAAEVNANSIYTTTGGFQIVSTAAGINASGGTYIYLAIA